VGRANRERFPKKGKPKNHQPQTKNTKLPRHGGNTTQQNNPRAPVSDPVQKGGGGGGPHLSNASVVRPEKKEKPKNGDATSHLRRPYIPSHNARNKRGLQNSGVGGGGLKRPRPEKAEWWPKESKTTPNQQTYHRSAISQAYQNLWAA